MREILIKSIGVFFIIYILHFGLFFVTNFLAIRTSAENALTLIRKSEWFYLFVVFVFSVVYIHKIRIGNVFIKSSIGKGLLISPILIYLTTFMLDPFHHNFSLDKVPAFEYNLTISGDVLFDMLLSVIVAPIFEELLFRNLLFEPFIKKKKIYSGILITSLLYSLNHWFPYNGNFHVDILAQVSYILIGVIFATVRLKYGLLFSILSHFTFNFISFGFSEGIFNLYLMDYIKSNLLYWGIYITAFIIIFYSMYRILESVVQLNRIE